MSILLCKEHNAQYMKEMPRKSRLAMRILGRVIKTSTGQTVIEIVEKDDCQVCSGLEWRKVAPINLCEEHQREYLLKQDMKLLMDPSFTLRIMQVSKNDCIQCTTGKAPE